MDNPYKAPEMSETTVAQAPKLSFFAYVGAMFSGLFVTFGFMIFVAFSHLLIGNWRAPGPIFALIPFCAIGLGILSGWQSLQQSRKKAQAKLKDSLSKSSV